MPAEHEVPPPPDPDEEKLAGSLAELTSRAEALERQLSEVQRQTEARLVRAELKNEALRAGMIDLDGLKLIDHHALKLNAEGEVEGAVKLMNELRRSKPWLFGAASSSSPAHVPMAHAPRPKMAGEMTDAEYRTARAALLRRRS